MSYFRHIKVKKSWCGFRCVGGGRVTRMVIVVHGLILYIYISERNYCIIAEYHNNIISSVMRYRFSKHIMLYNELYICQQRMACFYSNDAKNLREVGFEAAFDQKR